MHSDYAVLWDVDGVIIDSGEQHRLAWERMAAEEGLPFSNEKFWATFGMRNADIMPKLFGIQGPPERIERLSDRKEAIYRELLARDAVALPGARELLGALHIAGYRQALASSAPPANIEAIVRLLDLAPFLDAVVSGEHVAHGKPAPDIFLAAAQAVGILPARCLVIEDAPAGVAAAKAGGMRCIAVLRAGHPPATGLYAADVVVPSLTDVDVARVDALLGVAPERPASAENAGTE